MVVKMNQVSIHPLIDDGNNTSSESHDFCGGVLQCLCTNNKVEVSVNSQSSHNHACGCTKCWKPADATFSIISVVPRDKVSISKHQGKLHIVDEYALIQRYACRDCGVHMFGRIENKSHPFYGLDFIHTELSPQSGWSKVKFAAFVSSIIEGGTPPHKMSLIRNRLRELGLEPYDCLSPELMDVISIHAAKKAGIITE